MNKTVRWNFKYCFVTNLHKVYTIFSMLSAEAAPLYYAEQKSKIGTIELSLKPSIENQFTVDVSSRCVRVSYIVLVKFSPVVDFGRECLNFTV